MKAVNNPVNQSPVNTRLILILIGIITALISVIALAMELRTYLSVFSSHQSPEIWFTTFASQTVERFQSVIITLL